MKSAFDIHEQEIEKDPKVVYEKLLEMQPSTDEDCARHALLTIRSKNLAYIPLEAKDTTLVLEAIDYYKKNKNVDQVMLGYYLLGSIFRDMGDAPQGVEAFQKVIELADTTKESCDYRLMARAEAQKSDLQSFQKVLEKSIESSYNAERYAYLARDTSYAFDIAFGIITLHALRNHFEPLISETSLLIQRCLEFGDTMMVAKWATSLSWLYLQQGMTEEAQRMMLIYERYDGAPYPIYYGTKGELFFACRQRDSAEWCFRKELEATDWNNRQTAYRGLKKVYEQEQRLDSALKYATLQCEAVDSDYEHKVSEYIIQMEHIYNYEASKQQARLSEMKQQKQKSMMTVLLLFGGLVLFALATVFMVVRNRQQHRLQEKERELAQEEKRRAQSENRAAQMETILMQVREELDYQQAERNRIQLELAELYQSKNEESTTSEVTLLRIKELNTLLEEKEQDINEMEQEMRLKEQELLARQEEMDKMLDSIESLRQEAQQMEYFGNGVRQMRRQLEQGKQASFRNWEALQRQIVKLHPSFITTLRQQVRPILQNELRVAMLIKMDFQPAQIAELMGFSASFVSKTRRRMYAKAFGKEPGNMKDVDDWILSIS